jgi:hypothetical protein
MNRWWDGDIDNKEKLPEDAVSQAYIMDVILDAFSRGDQLSSDAIDPG